MKRSKIRCHGNRPTQEIADGGHLGENASASLTSADAADQLVGLKRGCRETKVRLLLSQTIQTSLVLRKKFNNNLGKFSKFCDTKIKILR